jgi:hypothetical protein
MAPPHLGYAVAATAAQIGGYVSGEPGICTPLGCPTSGT